MSSNSYSKQRPTHGRPAVCRPSPEQPGIEPGIYAKTTYLETTPPDQITLEILVSNDQQPAGSPVTTAINVQRGTVLGPAQAINGVPQPYTYTPPGTPGVDSWTVRATWPNGKISVGYFWVLNR